MRVLSGIQPSGRLHLGNYFGALQQHLELQRENEAFYFIAGYHALTTIHDATQLRDLTNGVALDYLALGLDPEKTTLFRQADVPQVTELCWVLSCVTPMGLLERAVSYKDKVAQGLIPNHGLFAYPVLQAADILIYLSEVVPVGQDQKQHIEMTRDIAAKFNNEFGETFVIPEARILESTAVVPGVDGRKMSKSYDNQIGIFEEGRPLKKRVMGIVTDPTPVEETKMVLFAFSPGQCLSEHTASVPASIHVLDGTASILLGDERHDAGPGTYVYMPAELKHAVDAKDKMVFLLTLHRGANG